MINKCKNWFGNYLGNFWKHLGNFLYPASGHRCKKLIEWNALTKVRFKETLLACRDGGLVDVKVDVVEVLGANEAVLVRAGDVKQPVQDLWTVRCIKLNLWRVVWNLSRRITLLGKCIWLKPPYLNFDSKENDEKINLIVFANNLNSLSVNTSQRHCISLRLFTTEMSENLGLIFQIFNATTDSCAPGSRKQDVYTIFVIEKA